MSRLPPLNTVHTFEVAATLGSFKLAAEQLNLTASAVSHQMRQLEDFLAVRLFVREGRNLQLSAEGRLFLNACRDGLDAIRRGVDSVSVEPPKGVLFSVLPFMASEWIMPRLAEFQQRYPDVNLRLEVSARLDDSHLEDIDVAIRMGSGEWRGWIAHHLLPIAGAPVCSPAFLEQHPISSPADIVDLPVLTITGAPTAWARWSEANGVPPFRPHSTLQMDNLLAHYQAAERGLGIAIGLFPLIQPWIDAGRLCAPLPQRIGISEAYYVYVRRQSAERADVQALLGWLQEIVAAITG